jgi:hypothetical protein
MLVRFFVNGEPAARIDRGDEFMIVSTRSSG